MDLRRAFDVYIAKQVFLAILVCFCISVHMHRSVQ